MRRVAVLGGGISGLAAAWRVRERARAAGHPVEVTVVEAGGRPGGKVLTSREGGWICEAGPQGFLDNEPATLRLVDDLGLRSRLLPSDQAAARRFIFRGGRFHELSMSPLKFLASPLLSFGAKLSMAGEFFRPARTDGADESVRDFGYRRLGKEFTDVMLDSMVSGIHAGDIARISIGAAFPRIVGMEREYGGLFRGMIGKKKEARRQARAEGGPARPVEAGPGGTLHSFDAGMMVPIETLAAQLGPQSLRLATVARRLEAVGRGYRLYLEETGGQACTLDCDAVVLALPGRDAGRLLEDFDGELAAPLAAIPTAGVHVVCLGYEPGQVGGDVEGFGTLIPRNQGLRTLGVLYVHATFDGHAPGEKVLLRAMVGGRHDAAANDLADEELVAVVRGELDERLRLRGEPVYRKVFRWNEGIPQYELGHLDRMARKDAALAAHPGLFVTGNSVCGIAFNSCVLDSERIAREAVAFLQESPSSEEAAP